jgi:hypothetical protein
VLSAFEACFAQGEWRENDLMFFLVLVELPTATFVLVSSLSQRQRWMQSILIVLKARQKALYE